MKVNKVRDLTHQWRLEKILGALKTDNPKSEFHLDITYKLQRGGTAGFFARPRYRIIDTTRGGILAENVFEIGDGVLQSTTDYRNNKIGLGLQLLGIPRRQPENLGLIGPANPHYFQEGSKARKTMKELGYEICLETEEFLAA